MIDFIDYKKEKIHDLVYGDNNLVEIASDYSEGGTDNYNYLENKPKIEGVELLGDKSLEELGLSAMTNEDILKILGRLQK